MRARRAGLAAAVVSLAIGFGGSATSDGAAATFGLHKIGGFVYPVGIETAPGAKHLLFVVGKTGRISVVRSGHPLSRPFLDISSRVLALGGEQGLLSLAFDPRYARNRRFYVDYVNNAGDVEIDQFRRSKGSRVRAVAHSRRTVLVIDHQQGDAHYGGQLEFDRGHLYVGVGDGGTPGDPENDAQSIRSLLGKILRLDPRPRGGYRVPHGNPFVGKPGRDLIFALGLRNPWRLSFDRKTGDLWIGDVGYASWEEIDRASLAKARGANFGWNLFEGPFPCTDCGNGGASPPPHYVPPIHSYPHHSATGGEEGDVIVGGFVVRGHALPSLAGRYVYTDNEDGDLRAFNPRTRKSRELGVTVSAPTSFGEGRNGGIYVASLMNPGAVYRLVQRP